MKIRFELAIIAALTIGCGQPQAIDDSSTNDSTLNMNSSTRSVVFYNVENLFDLKNDRDKNDDWFTPGSDIEWDKEKYDHKLKQLAKAISWTSKELPSLVGLAEVETASCVADLASTAPLSEGDYGFVHFESPDERGIDVGLLYRKAHFEVLNKAPMEVKLENDHTRDILHVEGRLDGEHIHVFVCHWSSRGEGVKETEHRRVSAARVVRAEVDDILEKDPNMNILIMGDLNDYPGDRSISETLGAGCNDEGATTDLVDLLCSEHKTGRGSYNYKGDWGYIDHFIVSRSLLAGPGFVAGEAKALFDDRLLFNHSKFGKSPDRTFGGRRYHGGFSDHLPIVMELSR